MIHDSLVINCRKVLILPFLYVGYLSNMKHDNDKVFVIHVTEMPHLLSTGKFCLIWLQSCFIFFQRFEFSR